MKNRVLSAAFKSTAIVLMLCTAFAIAFPMMHFINGKLYQLENYALTLVQEKTGLSVSYDSLSPAVLSGLHLKGINIYDSDAETLLLHIDSAKISYKLWPLIHGKITESIGGITIDGLQFHFNDEQNMKLVTRLVELFAGSGEEQEKEAEKTDEAGFRLPFPVAFNDCSFDVLFRGMTGKLVLESISLKSSTTAPYTTDVETKGNLSFIPDDTLTKLIPKLTTDVNIQAEITPDMNGTLGRFELKKADGGTFSFNDIAFVLGMKDRQLSLSLFTQDAPYGVEALWNMETGAVHAELNADGLQPLSVVKIKKQKGLAEKLEGLQIDGIYSLDAVLGGTELSDISYIVDGSVYLPPGIMQDALTVTAAIDGTLEHVNVSDLDVSTGQFAVNYYGEVNVPALSLSGYMKLGHYVLPSGKKVEGEFYIEDQEHGFSAFSPQIMLGDIPLTGVQIECIPDEKSADVSVSIYDYTHVEADVPGHIQLDGSVLYGDEQFLQASLSLENEYVDSLLRYALNVLPEEKALDPELVEKLAPYILTCEGYGSSDFETLSFNVPYMVAANTQKDGEMLLLSVDGNETTVQISQLELLYAGQTLSATVSADANEDYSQIFFSTDFILNDMPYYFSGVYDKGREIVVNGDYDFEFRTDLRVKNEIICSLYADAIPVKLGDYMFSASFDTDLDFISLENFWVTINRLAVSEDSGKIRIEPRIELSGFADNYGLMLETIDYGDSVSILSGNGSVSWNLTKEMLDSVSALIQLENPIGNERVSLDVSCSNPESVPFSSESLLKELYVSGMIDVEDMYASRFLEHQQNEDKVTVHGTVLGQLSNPFVSLDVPDVHVRVGDTPVQASMNVMLDDKVITVSGMDVTSHSYSVHDFGLSLSLDEIRGEGEGIVDITMDPVITASTPVLFSFALDGGAETIKNGLDFKKAGYEASLVFKDVQSDYDAVIKDYEIYVRHDEGMWYLSAGMVGGISGFLLDSGEFYLSVIEDFPIIFTADGSIKDSQLDIQVTDIKGNISTFRKFFGDSFSIEEGAFEGSLYLGGTTSDPDFEGSLDVAYMKMLIPGFITEPLIAPTAVLVAEGSEFNARQVRFHVGEARALIDLNIEMDRWSLASLNVAIHSAGGTYAPAKINVPYAECFGDADVHLNINMTGDDMSVTGSVNVINGLVELHSERDDEDESDDSDTDDDGRLFIDLNIGISQKAELYYPNKDNPLIRGLVMTQEPVHLVMDSDTAEMTLKGSLILRGGEILYLNRNFYLREGSIECDESGEKLDPRISFRAEIRERDEEGELIKIILSADRQKLSELSPVLSSEPSRTENEIRMLLGAALIADSGSTPGEVLASVAASGFDFLLQNSLFRQIENRLRDLCNFDIFSFRTPFIQQALLQAMNNSEETASIGNYFDNTTVYIGKYIGNTIYLDALLRFVYQENSIGGKNVPKLALQPEIGLELPSPFATIRWSIAPDITSAKNLWVPYTSISLSWSFKF